MSHFHKSAVRGSSQLVLRRYKRTKRGGQWEAELVLALQSVQRVEVKLFFLFKYVIFSSLYAESSFIMTKSACSVNWGLICCVFSKLEALTRIQQGAS